MKKFTFLTLAMLAAATTANADMTLQQKIAADSQRDPYAEAGNSNKLVFEEIDVVEEFIEPKAAEQMKPSKIFKLEKGNTIVK